ncbi:hypothetical protein MHU86_4175 [Fragilaria crotonensis]|nr:hypothetical protein MHU86_4175 [Fragilaria crotonensis]
MTEGTAPTPPSALPVDLTPSHTMYGFETDTWVDQPIPEAPDWFSRQERYRRNANAQAYRQYGHPTNWNRYIHLGLFVFEDCFECDKVWAAVNTDPLMVHRAIWYNFMSHVDRDLQVPVKLNDWATNISQPYLAVHDPTTLHETDTTAYSWKEMRFFKQQEEMEIDDAQAWIPVSGRRRSKSPPNQQSIINVNTSNVVGAFAPGFNLPPEELPRNYRPMENKLPEQRGQLPLIQKNKDVIERKGEKADQLNKTMRENKKQDSQQLPLGRNVTDNEVEQETQHVFGNNRHDLNEKESTTPWNNTTTQTAPHPNIPTNDGTHRVTIKWFPPEDLAVYESDKIK